MFVPLLFTGKCDKFQMNSGQSYVRLTLKPKINKKETMFTRFCSFKVP